MKFLGKRHKKELRKMNRIIVDKENNIDLKDNAVELTINVKELTINIKGRVLINEINKIDEEELKLTINVEPNSSLIYNRFMVHNKTNNSITLNQSYKSNVVFNYSMIAENRCNLIFNSNLTGNDNETEIKIKSVTEKNGSCHITSTANTKPKIENNNLIESIKILVLNNEESVCIPNLLVASNEIEVNHACTISSIDSDYLFYLNSRGLSIESATKLIKKGYLLSNLDTNEETNKQIEELIGGE